MRKIAPIKIFGLFLFVSFSAFIALIVYAPIQAEKEQTAKARQYMYSRAFNELHGKLLTLKGFSYISDSVICVESALDRSLTVDVKAKRYQSSSDALVPDASYQSLQKLLDNRRIALHERDVLFCVDKAKELGVIEVSRTGEEVSYLWEEKSWYSPVVPHYGIRYRPNRLKGSLYPDEKVLDKKSDFYFITRD